MPFDITFIPGDWEKFVFDVSLSVTHVLSITVALLAVLLFIRKVIERLWGRYSQRKTIELSALLDIYINTGGALSKAQLSHTSWGAQKILRQILLEKAENAAGTALVRCSEIYESVGYAQDHINTLKSSWLWWKRAEAAHHLGQMRIRRSKDVLLNALNDSSIEVRLEATWAIGHMGFVEELPRIVKSMSYFFKIAALRMDAFIFDMGTPVLPLLLDLCRHPEHEVKLLAIHIVGEFKNTEALPILIENLKSDNMECRLAACKAIGTLGHQDGLRALIPLAEDSTWQMRAQVAKQFGRNKFTEGISALKKGMEDQAWWVRFNTGEAFSLMGEDGIDALKEVKKQSSDRYARDMADQWLDDLGFEAA